MANSLLVHWHWRGGLSNNLLSKKHCFFILFTIQQQCGGWRDHCCALTFPAVDLQVSRGQVVVHILLVDLLKEALPLPQLEVLGGVVVQQPLGVVCLRWRDTWQKNKSKSQRPPLQLSGLNISLKRYRIMKIRTFLQTYRNSLPLHSSFLGTQWTKHSLLEIGVVHGAFWQPLINLCFETGSTFSFSIKACFLDVYQ